MKNLNNRQDARSTRKKFPKQMRFILAILASWR